MSIPTDPAQLRDYFAGQVLASGVSHGNSGHPERAATTAYAIADAMMKERDKPIPASTTAPQPRGTNQRDWDGNQNDR